MNRGRRPPVHYHTLLSCCCVVTSILTHTMALANSHPVIWCPQTIKQYTWSNNYADVHKAASLLTANVVCTGDYVHVTANLVCFIVHVISTVLQRVADRASENNLFLQYPIWMKFIFSVSPVHLHVVNRSSFLLSSRKQPRWWQVARA